MRTNQEILDAVRGGLIVSCQALPEEPLHSSYIMGRMAYAALEGGAVGIRANTAADINEIRRTVDLPIIGIVKKVYADVPELYITPTVDEIAALVECGADIIATDATARVRPGGYSLAEFYRQARTLVPHGLLMADCSTLEEGLAAAELGFDLIGTTLAGYTPQSKGCPLPPFPMLEVLVRQCGKPVIAEGNLWTPEDLRRAMDLGAFCAVVGSAITRPREITRRFVEALS